MVTTDDPERGRLDPPGPAARHVAGTPGGGTCPAAAGATTSHEAGLKANMTDVQAAIGRAQLRGASRAGRTDARQLAARYDALLAGVPGVWLPAPAGPARRARHAWHLYVVRVMPDARCDRDAVLAGLNERGIGTSVHFIPNHQQPYFRGVLGLESGRHFPEADRVSEQILSLPLHPWLTEPDVDRVCEELAALVSGPRRTFPSTVPASLAGGRAAAEHEEVRR